MDSEKYTRTASLVLLTLVLILPLLAFSVDLLGGSYPSLATKLNTKILLGEIAGIVIALTLISTLIVSLLRSALGTLEFSALGVKVKGQAAPVLYWVLLFISVSAVTVTLFGIFRPELGAY